MQTPESTVTTFTPGPWTVAGIEVRHDLSGPQRWSRRIFAGDRQIGSVALDTIGGEGNAALIAAAPDLLEALLDVQNQFLNPEEQHGGWRQRMAESVAAAIAKARGEG